MKKLIVATLLVSSSFAIQAEEYKLINSDGSDLSELCIAAVESNAAMLDTADALGIKNLQKESLVCNGMPVVEFVREYKTSITADSTLYAFNKDDESMETELCIAAVTSPVQFQQLKETYFSRVNVEEQVLCNNKPLSQFASKYRNAQITASVGL